MATILVVEDRAVDRKFLSTLLRSDGHVVIETSDGSEALAEFERVVPDLVISDILMPTVDGYQLVRRMREIPALARTPVMFYTATYHEREARTLAQQCGVVDILTKPVDSATMLRKVALLLEIGPRSKPSAADSGGFDREHLRLVSSTLASKTSDLERTQQRMAAIVEVAQEIATERDPRGLLARVCSAARQVTLAQYAVIGLLEPDQTASMLASGINPEQICSIDAAALNEPILASVLERRQVVRRRNPEGLPAVLGLPSDHPSVFSLLQVPIASATSVHGWLSLFNKLGADEFAESDAEVAVTLSTHAGIAYENARLYDETRRRAIELEQEVAERGRVEGILRDTQERVDFALSAAGIGVWEWDTGVDRVTWSASTRRVFGASGDAPRNFAEFLALVHDGDRQRLADAAQQALATSTDLEIEFRVRWPDASVHRLDTRARVLNDADGLPRRLIGVTSDATSRRSLEEQLRQAQKMEAIGQLAGGIAHDFNNVLTAIIGYAQFLAVAPDLSELHRRDLEEVMRAGQRAATLTRQLLAFSRKQVLQPVALDLNAMLRDTSHMLRRLIGEHIELTTRLAPDLAAVHADPGQLEQIVINLAVNARDAMPTGGRLVIETANVTLDDAYAVRHVDVPPGAYVMLAVSDTGTGLTPEAKQRLFEPFFTTKPAGQGTGLGLSTVYGIVRQSGGSIWVYSEPGEGATFKVYLPRATGPTVTERSAEAGVDLARGTETILVVEDDRAVRLLICAVLRRAGYTVLDADDPRVVPALLETHVSDVHLLISDVVMPGLSGPKLFEQLHATHPELKVLYVSGYTDGAIVTNGHLHPGVEFLQKPFSGVGLTRRVREVLDS